MNLSFDMQLLLEGIFMKIRCACIHRQKSNSDFTVKLLNYIDWSHISSHKKRSSKHKKVQNID